MNGELEVLDRADILVQGNRISQIGRSLKLGTAARRVIDAEGKVVIPGLIHGHLHSCQTLFRNQADGFELLEWLRERIWPLESAHDARSIRASADLTFLELIDSGATAALDMGTVHHTDTIFESAREAKFRLTAGKAMMDAGQGVPAGLRESTRDSVGESLRLCRDWHNSQSGMLRYAFAPRFALSCSSELLREVSHQAREMNVRIHSHASENARECDAVRQRTGQDNIDYFHGLGISGPHVTLAHCVWLTALEQRILQQTQTVVCHCPSSNLKLGSGIAKIPELLEEGVRVCLGADGAACNNNLDIFQEMRLAAMIHNPRRGAACIPPMRVLQMATSGGAHALGLADRLGSIEQGKLADLTIVDFRRSHAVPRGEDVVAQIVYSGKASDVCDVVIDGEIVMKDRCLLTLDRDETLARAASEALALSARL